MATRKAAKKAAKKTAKAPVKTAGRTSAKTAANKSAAKKTATRKTAHKSATPPSRRWSAAVTSDSTHPSEGLFKKSGKAIAKEMLKTSVSPKGPGQAMQMLSFYENRAGKNLPAERKAALEQAKKIVRNEEDRQASSGNSAKHSKSKS